MVLESTLYPGLPSLERVLVMLRDKFIPVYALDLLRGYDSDCCQTSAEYLPVANMKQCSKKAQPWILDSLGCFEPEALLGHVLEEIHKAFLQ